MLTLTKARVERKGNARAQHTCAHIIHVAALRFLPRFMGLSQGKRALVALVAACIAPYLHAHDLTLLFPLASIQRPMAMILEPYWPMAFTITASCPSSRAHHLHAHFMHAYHVYNYHLYLQKLQHKIRVFLFACMAHTYEYKP